MGRKQQFSENVLVPLVEGTKARLDAATEEGETRLDVIREAIERELKRRKRRPPEPKSP